MLKDELTAHLTNTLIPFWQSLRDDRLGGYYGWMDFSHRVDQSAEKGCILNSRILWFFSRAYLTLNDPRLLSDATHAYHALCRMTDDAHGGVYWSVTADFTPLDTTKHTYNQAFAIYALCAYSEAAGDPLALERAISLYDLIEARCTDEYGYCEAFTRDFLPQSNEKLSENGVLADKTMNTLLHVMEAYTQLYRLTRLARVGSRLKWILSVFAEKVYSPAKRRQEVFFNRRMESILDIQSFGHDIESAWLVDYACEVLADEALCQQLGPLTRELTASVYERAYCGHSILNERVRGETDKTRVWWVQAEAMVGFLNGWQKSGEQAYWDAAQAIWEYIKAHLLDKRAGGEWYWEVDSNGLPNERKPIVEPWKCPYHNGRMCMQLIERIK